MGNPSDFYGVLGLANNSSPQEIRTAYKILAKKWHPDKHPDSSKAEAEARFKAISQAYEALIDQEPRTIARDHGVNQRQSLGGNLRRSCSSVKPPPIERRLECTLEELFWGSKKEVKFTRDVITASGFVVRKAESHTIRVKPGWRKGTRIIFDSMGDERPGWRPPAADVEFVISEKKHHLFKRAGDDLVLKVKVPLANALTGWSFSFRHLSGERVRCSFDDEIIFHGFEKVIRGQGMPLARENGARGNLKIKFDVVFPQKLSEEQRMRAVELLKD